jgi:hypothetical protein
MIRYRRDHEGNLHKVVMHEGFEGFVVRWTDECTGCTEREDGHLVGEYGWDPKAKCTVGAGCDECGYTGKSRRAQWVAFDGAYYEYEDRKWEKEHAAS